MITTKRIRTVTAHHSKIARPRKLGVTIQNTEFYSKEDLETIHEGFEQIKRGEYVSYDEIRRREGL